MKLARRVARVAVFVAFGLVATAAPSRAAVITFDNMTAPALLSNAVALTNQLAGVGVVFSGTGAVLNSGSAFGVTGFSAPNFLAYREGLTIDFSGARVTSRAFDSLMFSTPLNALSFQVGSGAGISSGDMFQVRAFQGLTLVDSETVTLASMLQLVTLSGPAFTRIDYGIIGARSLDGFVVDNVNFTQVPEPVTMALLGSGLAAFGVRRARRRRS